MFAWGVAINKRGGVHDSLAGGLEGVKVEILAVSTEKGELLRLVDGKGC